MSEERKKTLLEYIRAGADLEEACRAIGITSRTLRNWRTHAAEDPPREPYASFIDQIEQVEAQYAIEATALINQVGRGRALGAKDGKGKPLPPYELPPDWKALAWGLGKRFPKRWGEMQKIEHTGKDGGAIKFEGTATPEAAAAATREAFGGHARRALEADEQAEAETDPEKPAVG